jgi:hypothetical protein
MVFLYHNQRLYSLAWTWFTVLAALLGTLLILDTNLISSATYDELTYLNVATHWWRTGDQSEISRMGSPLTFWKLQQVLVLWLVDYVGYGNWIDQPITYQQEILPLSRLSSTWIWLVAFAITVCWSRHSCGPRAMTFAAWLFALSPNLIAHSALVTMELPLVASTTVMFWLFWRFLETNRQQCFWITSTVGGLAFSCKFTTVLVPPILGIVWWIVDWQKGNRRLNSVTQQVALSMIGFMLIMLFSNVVVTLFARLPLSKSYGGHPTIDNSFGSTTGELLSPLYEIPIPQDWVGFIGQTHHQVYGGRSYLFSECRMTGWWYYYLVAIAVKVPLAFWLLAAVQLAFLKLKLFELRVKAHHLVFPLIFSLYVAIALIGSSRNYGMRYLLPLAPLAIVWISALTDWSSAYSRRMLLLRYVLVLAGLIGYLISVAGIHPYELTYFNRLAGGPEGGRHILADSNLDWGQGLKALARLQRNRPDLSDMTLYYFGNTEPVHYPIFGSSYVVKAVGNSSGLASLDSVKTRYLAVSASLQWGPWGPPGFFHALVHVNPLQLTDDKTIAIYCTADL